MKDELTQTKQKKKIIKLPASMKKAYKILWKFFYNYLNKFLNNNEYFYLLFHPADFTSNEDIPKKYNNYLQRFNISVEKKISILEKIFLIISKSKRKCVTMKELARQYIKK